MLWWTTDERRIILNLKPRLLLPRKARSNNILTFCLKALCQLSSALNKKWFLSFTQQGQIDSQFTIVYTWKPWPPIKKQICLASKGYFSKIITENAGNSNVLFSKGWSIIFSLYMLPLSVIIREFTVYRQITNWRNQHKVSYSNVLVHMYSFSVLWLYKSLHSTGGM